jgi:tetratricopeptide (TPR) repeat protein
LSQVEAIVGDLDAAIEFSNNALELDPRYIPAIITRANLYAFKLEMEPARVSFEKLLLFDDPVLKSLGDEGIGFVEFLSGRFERGAASMDEAIRNAMLAGSVRHGLSQAFTLVRYLCELGQTEAAAEVISRWVTGFGDVPVRLGRLRIRILKGEIDAARRDMIQMRTQRDWAEWMSALSVDLTEMSALAYIREDNYAKALNAIEQGNTTTDDLRGRREFLRGYAAFESGDAETAKQAFAAVRDRLFVVGYTHRGDPVLFAQSLFYLAEAALATGDLESAREYYGRFLALWGDARWELHAVERAAEKIKTLEQLPAPN